MRVRQTMGFTWLWVPICALAIMACGESSVVNDAVKPGTDLGADVTSEDTASEDGSEPVDVASEDVDDMNAPEPSSCDPGEGCFEEACESGEDCLSGICTMHLGNKVCSKTCDESCPQGWSCTLVGAGGDGQYVCLSMFSHLCLPCEDSGSCSNDTINACVKYGDGTSFCGGACDLETPCPLGYSCQEVETSSGAFNYQCVSTAGVCECSDLAIASGLATPCETSNDVGVCKGARICTADGLAECTAEEATPEVCNGIDDNCDGGLDENTCDDGNACTIDLCQGEDGCVYESLMEGECLDGDACTIGDHCEEGVCVGKPIDCEDGNPCTLDSCDGLGGCQSENVTALCDDGDPCTLGDLCQEGVCVGSANLACDDGNPCTDDACGEGGCDHTANVAECDDGNACTQVDLCADMVCAGAQVACDDGNVCTTDSCDVLLGCVVANNANPCDDGDVCSQGDICQAGTCQTGASEATCADGNPCTTDGCDAELGCVFSPNGEACDDKNNCTTSDTCVEGACLGSGSLACNDDNPCTLDSCLPGGGCTHEASPGACDDGDACTINDSCDSGTCLSGAVLSCDDGNPCTDEGCQEGDCLFEANAIACDDGNACTSASVCTEGACKGTAASVCDDGNVCTADTCDPANGCVYTNLAAPCDDGELCTSGDSCVDGDCESGALLNCEDGNPCTDESCSGGKCVFQDNASECDDANACTAEDGCSEGLCVGQAGVSCDDGNPCTNDACDAQNGCVYTDSAEACDDGNACTVGDACSEGQCQAGEGALACDDGLFCNGTETCAADTGCVAGVQPSDDDGIACTVESCNEETDTIQHQPDDGLCEAPGDALCKVGLCSTVSGCYVDDAANCCGNGIVEDGEDCDDSNQVGDDGCSPACQEEITSDCPGNGVSGFYDIDPDGAGPEGAFSVYCESMDGGGWLHVATLNTADGHMSNLADSYWTANVYGDVLQSFSADYKGLGATKVTGTELLLVVRMNSDPEGADPVGYRSWKLNAPKTFQSFFDGPMGSGNANQTGGCNGGYSGDGTKQTAGILNAGKAAPFDTFTGHAVDIYTNSYYGACGATQDGFRMSSWYRWGNNSSVGLGLQMDDQNNTYDVEAGAHMAIETYVNPQRFCSCSCDGCQMPGGDGSHSSTSTRIAFGTDYQTSQFTLGENYSYRFEWYVR
jgi:cysteine-rich repeat protein